MGSCAYYLKAEFPTVASAKKAQKKLQTFFKEAATIYNYWQKGRFEKKDFALSEIEKMSPMVHSYILSLNIPPPWDSVSMNNLSGQFDFGQDNDYNTVLTGTVINYFHPDIGHLTTWTPLCEFIKKEFGACKVVWGNEENGCGSLESLQLYDWEGIVKDILKNKEILPLLLNVNPDLTTLLERALK